MNLFLTFDVESNRPGDYITCDHVPGAPGLFWIMDELEHRGLRGVFFVNVYEHTRYPDGWMHGIVRQIHNRGHEVGLHCHLNGDLDFYRRNLTEYDLEGQVRIIRYGVDFIEAATGTRPVSFRSGALRINPDTFAALGHSGVGFDSSLKYFQNKHNNNNIEKYLSVNRSMRYGDVIEFPITIINRDHRQARLDPNSTPDAKGLIAAIEQMVAAGCNDAVFMAHSFSFVLSTVDPTLAIPGTPIFMKNRKSPNYAKGQDAAMKSLFVEFLDFVKSQDMRIRNRLFQEVEIVDGLGAASGADFVPRIPFNGLRAWPGSEEYTKHRKAANQKPRSTYRTAPKRLVLHAGTWKTGSKALQKFWALNKDELARRGIFYPLKQDASYMKGANRSYQSLIATSGDPDRRSRLKALAEEICADNHGICLVSHENICNLSRSELLEFVSCLSGCRFEIVLYLRRQDHYAASLYNQHVKARVAFAGSFDEHFEQYRSRYDYRQMVERLGSVFGLENLVVRPYEQDQFHGGTIFSDFMHHAFRQDIDDGFALPKKDQNSRLDREALEFKRIANSFSLSKEETLKLGRYLVEYCVDRDARARMPFQEHDLLSFEQRTQLLCSFADGNEWIARELLARDDGALFHDEVAIPNDGELPHGGLTCDKAIEIALHVYRTMLREVEHRDAEVGRLKGGRLRAVKRWTEDKRGRGQAKQNGASLARVVKRSWRHGKAFASRVWAGTDPKSGRSG